MYVSLPCALLCHAVPLCRVPFFAIRYCFAVSRALPCGTALSCAVLCRVVLLCHVRFFVVHWCFAICVGPPGSRRSPPAQPRSTHLCCVPWTGARQSDHLVVNPSQDAQLCAMWR